ncbi:MAG: M50 family metallopeptidase [Chlamydiia bacterium]|nr:M50 family metallopeptidase [Chlamydiia bacterium]
MINSLLFGASGSYTIFGHEVEFQSELEQRTLSISTKMEHAALCFESTLKKVVAVITLIFPAILVHELGHAFAAELVTQKSSKIVIETDKYRGQCHTTHFHPLIREEKFFISIAGAVTNIAFQTTLILVAIVALKKIYTEWGIRFVITRLVNVYSEISYALDSAVKNNDGDFGVIRRLGPAYLTAGVVTLIAQIFFSGIVVMGVCAPF